MTMSRKQLSFVFSLLLFGGDLARIASTSAPPASDGLLVAPSHDTQTVVVVSPSTTVRPLPPTTVRPCVTPTPPCAPNQLVIPLPQLQLSNPCANPCAPLPPPLPPKPTLPPPPVVRPCIPSCAVPAPTCNPCAAPVPAKAPLSLWPVALKGLKVWKMGTAALAAPALLAGAKIAGAAALLPVKLAIKGAILGGLIAKPIIVGTTLVTAGAVKLAATVVGIPVAIVTGVKAAAVGLRNLFSGASLLATNTLSTPLRLGNGLSLVAVGYGADALARILDSAGRSAVQKAQTLATYGAATQALGSKDLAWGFDDPSCSTLYVMQPVAAASASGSGASASALSNNVSEEEDWILPDEEPLGPLPALPAIESRPAEEGEVIVPASPNESLAVNQPNGV